MLSLPVCKGLLIFTAIFAETFEVSVGKEGMVASAELFSLDLLPLLFSRLSEILEAGNIKIIYNCYKLRNVTLD